MNWKCLFGFHEYKLFEFLGFPPKIEENGHIIIQYYMGRKSDYISICRVCNKEKFHYGKFGIPNGEK